MASGVNWLTWPTCTHPVQGKVWSGSPGSAAFACAYTCYLPECVDSARSWVKMVTSLDIQNWADIDL